MCKEFAYKILNCRKLDWLKKEKDWKLDKITYLSFGILFLSFMALYYVGSNILIPMMFIIWILWIIGEIRMIKNTSGNIESKIMFPLLCIRYIFLALWTLDLIGSLIMLILK